VVHGRRRASSSGKFGWGTQNSLRSVADELGGYLAGRPRDSEDLVFPALLGGPLRPHTWIKSFFKPAVRAAGLPEDLRLYDLRHTCASLLIALEQARMAALVNRERTQRGPVVLMLNESAGR
jgi:integrase